MIAERGFLNLLNLRGGRLCNWRLVTLANTLPSPRTALRIGVDEGYCLTAYSQNIQTRNLTGG
jgi:hypothetical protein